MNNSSSTSTSLTKEKSGTISVSAAVGKNDRNSKINASSDTAAAIKNGTTTPSKKKSSPSKSKKASSPPSSRRRRQRITVGCRGDPRMNEAVSHRLAHPTLSLTDALLRGGFSFGIQTLPPPPGVLDRNVLDDDGVSLQQRKNQLMRRLRKAREQMEKQRQKHQEKKEVDRATEAVLRPAAAAPDETVATGADGEYYARINSKRRKTARGEDTSATTGATEDETWRQQMHPVAASLNAGDGAAGDAPSIHFDVAVNVGNIDVLPGGPTILDRLTALEQVQSALRMNAEMQRHILAEQQQQEAHRKDIAEDSHRIDNKEGANDNHTNNEQHGHRDNPTQEEATRQEVQELQHNLQRLVEDVLVTESDRHDDDMLKDYLPDDSGAAVGAASLAATAAAAEHIRRTSSASSTPSVHGTQQLATTTTTMPTTTLYMPGLQMHSVPTLFGAAPSGGIGTASAGTGTHAHVPNVVGALNVAAVAAAVPPPLHVPTTVTCTLTGGQYLGQTMMQEQMTAFRRQQVAAFAELAAAAATGSRHQNR